MKWLDKTRGSFPATAQRPRHEPGKRRFPAHSGMEQGFRHGKEKPQGRFPPVKNPSNYLRGEMIGEIVGGGEEA